MMSDIEALTSLAREELASMHGDYVSRFPWHTRLRDRLFYVGEDIASARADFSEVPYHCAGPRLGLDRAVAELPGLGEGYVPRREGEMRPDWVEKFLQQVELQSPTQAEGSCDICQIAYGTREGDRNYELPVRLRCEHMFGKDCIMQWLTQRDEDGEYNSSCPMCRAVVVDDAGAMPPSPIISPFPGLFRQRDRPGNWLRRLARTQAVRQAHPEWPEGVAIVPFGRYSLEGPADGYFTLEVRRAWLDEWIEDCFRAVRRTGAAVQIELEEDLESVTRAFFSVFDGHDLTMDMIRETLLGVVNETAGACYERAVHLNYMRVALQDPRDWLELYVEHLIECITMSQLR